MNSPLISVIVPVYKAEDLLDRCVESLVRQSYERLEILLVDDGSPDGCPALCDAWAEKDARIQALHKPNGGLADARNFGVTHAAGDYILFVDDDDYIAPDAVSYLLSLLADGQADVAVGAWREVYDGSEDFSSQPAESVHFFTPEEACLALMGNDWYMSLVTTWGKLYPAALLRANAFPVWSLHEDEATTYKFYDQCRGVALGSRVIYAYYQNRAGIVHNRTARHHESTLRCWEEQVAYFRERGERRQQLAAADRLLNVAVDHADKGEAAFRDYLKSGRGKPYLLPGTRLKTRVRYYGYRLFGVDLNKVYHTILGK